MLKIEPNKTISIHPRSPGSKKYLLYAFFIALSLHLFGFVLFQIKPFLIPETQWTFPPVFVDSGAKAISTGQDVAAQNEWDVKIPKTVLIPKTSIPDFIIAPQSIDQLPEVDLVISLNPIKMSLNGALSERALLIEPPQTPLKISSTSVSQRKALYKVYISSVEGKVFWLESVDGDLSRSEQNEVEKFLLESQFVTKPQDVFVTGEIEVIYTHEKI
jgi:hypothetical protein